MIEQVILILQAKCVQSVLKIVLTEDDGSSSSLEMRVRVFVYIHVFTTINSLAAYC